MLQIIRVVAVDPHPVFLEGLACSLRTYNDIEIVGLTTEPAELTSLVLQHSPDVVLIDALMFGGIKAARSLTHAHKSTKVIMLTDSIDAIPETAIEVSGGRAWVLKTTGAAYLASTIRITQSGGFTIGPGLSGRIVLLGDRLIDRSTLASYDSPIRFSGREYDVMRHVCQGSSNREMAEALGIQETTVRNYIVKIKRKLRATSRRDVARLSSRYMRNVVCLLCASIGTQQFVGYVFEVL